MTLMFRYGIKAPAFCRQSRTDAAATRAARAKYSVLSGFGQQAMPQAEDKGSFYAGRSRAPLFMSLFAPGQSTSLQQEVLFYGD